MQFKKKRELTGMSQLEVATKLGISNTAVSMWESGSSKPRIDILIKLAELYNCTVDELLSSQSQAS